MWQHGFKICFKRVDARMTVMLVINNSNIINFVMLFQILTNCNHIRWISGPTTVIIKPDFTAHLLSFGNCRQACFSGLLYSLLLSPFAWLRNHKPNLWAQVIFFEQLKCFFMHIPKCEVLEAMLFILKYFLLKGCDMFLTPVVCDPL